MTALLSNRKNHRPRVCPVCRSEKVAKVVYRTWLTDEEMRKLGGIGVDWVPGGDLGPPIYDWQCQNCYHTWATRRRHLRR